MNPQSRRKKPKGPSSKQETTPSKSTTEIPVLALSPKATTPTNAKKTNRSNHKKHHRSPRKETTAPMTVIITKVKLLDDAAALRVVAMQQLQHLDLIMSTDLSIGENSNGACSPSSSPPSSVSSPPPLSPSSVSSTSSTCSSSDSSNPGVVVPGDQQQIIMPLSPRQKSSNSPPLQTVTLPPVLVLPYAFHFRNGHHYNHRDVATMRIPHAITPSHTHYHHHINNKCTTCFHPDDIPNPFPGEVHDKYWFQRKRLFSKFDEGILLDKESWYSVTPELIADYVAEEVAQIVSEVLWKRRYTNINFHNHGHRGIFLLDAFCGCGGNSIAFGKLPMHLIDTVICVDIDRAKLKRATHNANLYNIPKHKLLFVEANTLWVLDQCYRNGYLDVNSTYFQRNRDNPNIRDDSYIREICEGYTIGGIDLLPSHIDAVFLDPPWGGVGYTNAGRSGYDLQKNIQIPYYDRSFRKHDYIEDQQEYHLTNIDGFHLLKMAASATVSKLVIYDLPRNTNRFSLGRAALFAGYYGNAKLEEHFLNNRLKTVTAYFGKDFREELYREFCP